MSKIETLHRALVKYLKHNNWIVEPSSENVSLWCNAHLMESIKLPSNNGLQHPRACRTLKEAIEDLSDTLNITVTELEQLLAPTADHFHIRAAGEAIEHGRINFRTNHKIESAIYSIIKTAAESYIKVDKRRKKDKAPTKTEFIESYLNSVNTVIPTGGSFIYNLDIDLTKSKGFEGAESLQRYVNSRLAKALNEIHTIDTNKVTTATLIGKGLNESICSNFINLFDRDIELIECTFDWSESEPAPPLIKSKLTFTREHKDKVLKLKEKFNSSRAIPLKNAYAHLSRFDLKSDHASIRLKIVLEGAERTCDAEIDKDTAQELMKTLGENIEQPVMIDATAWIEKTASKNHYSLSDITSISSEAGKNLPLF
ncbi:hypothetical protein AB4552_00925 [Vibrio sp. 10N.222.54.C3]|uniref:hypothetical protein n=1 Tax=Vibrio sp. 10N.222.54.C3 TaxID=3229640 RepID=UPI00354B5692